MLTKSTHNALYSGTAIYTYFIVPDNVSNFAIGVTILANMSVFLDDVFVNDPAFIPERFDGNASSEVRTVFLVSEVYQSINFFRLDCHHIL